VYIRVEASGSLGAIQMLAAHLRMERDCHVIDCPIKCGQSFKWRRWPPLNGTRLPSEQLLEGPRHGAARTFDLKRGVGVLNHRNPTV